MKAIVYASLVLCWSLGCTHTRSGKDVLQVAVQNERSLKAGLSDSCPTVSFLPDTDRLLTDIDGGPPALWSVSKGRTVRTYAQVAEDEGLVVAAPEGTEFATASREATLVWDTASGKLIREVPALYKPGRLSMAYSPDGKVLAISDFTLRDGSVIRLFDRGDWREVKQLRDPTFDEFGYPAFSPDSQKLVVVVPMDLDKRDGGWLVFDIRNGQARFLRLGMHNPGQAVFSPDGRRIVAGSDIGLLVWDVATGQKLAQIRTTDAYGVSWSPDGRVFATGGWRNVVGIWDASTYEELATFGGHLTMAPGARTTGLSWSPDGRLLAVGSYDGNVRIWRVTISPTTHPAGSAANSE